MGKITIALSDETEKKLRTYVTSKFPEKPYGKISEVVELAVKEWLSREK